MSLENREKLVEELAILRKRLKEINLSLNEIDHDNRLNSAKQYVGKYYRDKDDSNGRFIKTIFIYGVDELNCQLKSLGVTYWHENDVSGWFEIEDSTISQPKTWDDDEEERWIEISKEEYMKHYDLAHELMLKIVEN